MISSFNLVGWKTCEVLVYWQHSCSLYSSRFLQMLEKVLSEQGLTWLSSISRCALTVQHRWERRQSGCYTEIWASSISEFIICSLLLCVLTFSSIFVQHVARILLSTFSLPYA